VRTVPLIKLHRLGVSLVGKLRRLATALVGKNPFAVLRPAIDIFEPEDGEILACLSRTRPAFPKAPGHAACPWASAPSPAWRILPWPRWRSRAAAAVEMVTGLGVRPQQLTPEALEAMAKADVPAAQRSPSTQPASTPAFWPERCWWRGSSAASLAPLVVLPRAAIEKFKKDFNSGRSNYQ
jgi:hypothetical protein